MHKLWVAAERPASEAAKARKDIRQAEQVPEVLLEDRPDDVRAAWSALAHRKSLVRSAEAEHAAAAQDDQHSSIVPSHAIVTRV